MYNKLLYINPIIFMNFIPPSSAVAPTTSSPLQVSPYPAQAHRFASVTHVAL